MQLSSATQFLDFVMEGFGRGLESVGDMDGRKIAARKRVRTSGVNTVTP
jgi:hypothetical protein